jgi:hypothetical protein
VAHCQQREAIINLGNQIAQRAARRGSTGRQLIERRCDDSTEAMMRRDLPRVGHRDFREAEKRGDE